MTVTRSASKYGTLQTDGADHTIPPDLLPGPIVIYEIDNLTNARQDVYFPSGAVAISISYKQSGTIAATGRFAYVAANATSDPDADGKLSTTGLRDPVPFDDTVASLIDTNIPVTRLSLIAAYAESGHSKIIIKARIRS